MRQYAGSFVERLRTCRFIDPRGGELRSVSTLAELEPVMKDRDGAIRMLLLDQA